MRQPGPQAAPSKPVWVAECFSRLVVSNYKKDRRTVKADTEMTGWEIRSYRESDEKAVVQLWRDSGLVVPWNDSVKDIRRKLRIQRDMFLVGLRSARLIATVMAGYEWPSRLDQLSGSCSGLPEEWLRELPDGGGGSTLESTGLPQDQRASQKFKR